MTSKVPTDDKTKAVVDVVADSYTPSALPVGADGGIAPGAFPVDKSPLMDFDDGRCKAGPCRHYWELKTPFDTAGGAQAYKELGHKAPVQFIRTCCAHQGTETELSGDLPVLECSRWDPLTTSEITNLKRRRQEWEKAHAGVPTSSSGSRDVEKAGEEDAARQHDDVSSE